MSADWQSIILYAWTGLWKLIVAFWISSGTCVSVHMQYVALCLQVCFQRQCVPLTNLNIPPCLVGGNGLTCSGNGVRQGESDIVCGLSVLIGDWTCTFTKLQHSTFRHYIYSLHKIHIQWTLLSPEHYPNNIQHFLFLQICNNDNDCSCNVGFGGSVCTELIDVPSGPSGPSGPSASASGVCVCVCVCVCVPTLCQALNIQCR